MAVQFTVMSIDDEQVSAPRKSIFLKDKISIGRSRLNDLVLEHPGVSNSHATVRVEGANGTVKFFISDLGSTNGTMVGTRRLDPRVETFIPERDRVMIAGYILKMESVKDADSPTSFRAHEQHIHSSSEESVPDGKATTTFTLPEVAARLEKEGQKGDSARTVWNSSLLGAFRGADKRKERSQSSEQAADKLVLESKSQDRSQAKTEQPTPPHGVQPLSSLAEKAMEAKEKGSEEPGEIPGFGAEAKLLLEQNLELDFVATKLLTLSGRVLHKGIGLAGVVVRDPSLGETKSDQDGSFSFSEIVDGTAYSLTLDRPGYVLNSEGPLDGLLSDADIDLRVVARQLFSISGRITHKGISLEDVTVDGGKLGVVKTDATGSYRFHNVPEGEEYTLKASKDGFIFGTVRKVA